MELHELSDEILLDAAADFAEADVTRLAARLYHAGWSPPTPAWRARFPEARMARKYVLACSAGMSVQNGWRGDPSDPHWHFWTRVNRPPEAIGGKVYISPRLGAIEAALAS